MADMVGDTQQDGMIATGTRLRCGHCGAEAIVTTAGEATLRCCGEPMEVLFTRSGT